MIYCYKYNNAYQSTIKIKPTDRKSNTYIDPGPW